MITKDNLNLMATLIENGSTRSAVTANAFVTSLDLFIEDGVNESGETNFNYAACAIGAAAISLMGENVDPDIALPDLISLIADETGIHLGKEKCSVYLNGEEVVQRLSLMLGIGEATRVLNNRLEVAQVLRNAIIDRVGVTHLNLNSATEKKLLWRI
jgi:hypothetical protein